jgi:7-carboxy-7-deazaguanine synthase
MQTVVGGTHRRDVARVCETVIQTYRVKEIYYTIQGEGRNVGRPAVFCRFSGCNLWSGQERARSNAICRMCDTDFVGADGPGGGSFHTADALADAIRQTWPHPIAERKAVVVCTGGEPLLQLNRKLVDMLHEKNFEIALETNGTLLPPPGIDWICVSPKARAELKLREGDELKLVYPQEDGEPEKYEDLDFSYFYLQPMDGPDRERNTELAIRYCLDHPRWRLSLQTHKFIGIR